MTASPSRHPALVVLFLPIDLLFSSPRGNNRCPRGCLNDPDIFKKEGEPCEH